MKNKRIVITGIGILSPIGIGKEDYWQGLKKGRLGIKKITLFDTARFKIKMGGEITGFNPKAILGRTGLVDLDRATTLLSSATKFALEDSGLGITKRNQKRIGIAVGTTLGNLNSLSEFDTTGLTQGPSFVNPSRFPNIVANSPASRAAIRFGIKGFNTTISSGACAGADAIEYAVNALNFNRADRVLAGAVEEMSFRTFLGFYRSGYLSGAEKREGIVFAEGSTVVLLETLEAAIKRNAKIYAEIASMASNFDPSSGMAKAMGSAISASGLEKKDIDAIYASARSIKSLIGDSYSSSGLMNVAAALGSLEENARLRAVMINSFDVGGSNSVIILKKFLC